MEPSPRQLNKRCLCGSGKAFKNCHGQENLLKRRPKVPVYNSEPNDFLDAPGYTYLTSILLSEDEDKPRSDPQGEPGEYEATFTLLQPGQAAERLAGSGLTRIFEVQYEATEGDSHLALFLPKDARPSSNAGIGRVNLFQIDKDDDSAAGMKIILKPNEHGRLSRVIIILEAENFLDAEKRAYFEAASLLSYLAFELDIPLRIAHVSIKEIASGQVTVGFVRQFGYKGMGNLTSRDVGGNWSALKIVGGAHAALTSVYREALNSESPFYQFLCFCRVIQRLKERLRPRWERMIVERDIRLLPTYRKLERFPDGGEEDEKFTEDVRGMKFTAVYDDRLRPLRNGIGHIFLEDMSDEDSLERSTDEYEFLHDVYKLLPVAHHVARTMLKNDFGQSGLAQVAARLAQRSGEH